MTLGLQQLSALQIVDRDRNCGVGGYLDSWESKNGDNWVRRMRMIRGEEPTPDHV